MEAVAVLKYSRIAPSKVRQVLRLIRDKSVIEARTALKYCNKRASNIVLKVLNSAVANLQNKSASIRDEEIVIKKVHADGGPVLKRFRPRAMGRATVIRKRTSHITVEVSN